MRWTLGAIGAASLMGTSFAQADSTKVTDPDTGLNWASFTSQHGLTFRVAVPDRVAEKAEFDTAFQIIAPAHLGWVGLAWGGSMTYNPLAVNWPNDVKQEVTVSSRIAFSFSPPPVYDMATYTVLKKGTHINVTHWQVTAKCSGCSKWGDEDTGITLLDAKGENWLAYAYSTVPVHDAAKNDSSFNMHDGFDHWVHDFSQGANTNFAATLDKIA